MFTIISNGQHLNIKHTHTHTHTYPFELDQMLTHQRKSHLQEEEALNVRIEKLESFIS